MDHRLLEIIACPVCNGKLWYNQEKQELICKLDNLAFPLRDGIPVLLETEARVLSLTGDRRASYILHRQRLQRRGRHPHDRLPR